MNEVGAIVPFNGHKCPFCETKEVDWESYTYKCGYSGVLNFNNRTKQTVKTICRNTTRVKVKPRRFVRVRGGT